MAGRRRDEVENKAGRQEREEREKEAWETWKGEQMMREGKWDVEQKGWEVKSGMEPGCVKWRVKGRRRGKESGEVRDASESFKVSSIVRIGPPPRTQLKRSWQWEYCSPSAFLHSVFVSCFTSIISSPSCLSECESTSTSRLCNCASTRCLQGGKVDGLITGLALGVRRHFQAERFAHSNILVASLVSLTSPAFIVSHILRIVLNPPPLSRLFCCLINGETHQGLLLLWALSLLSCCLPFHPKHARHPPFTLSPSASPLVCLVRCVTVVRQPGSFPSFPFDASQHISLEQASASWEQNSCLVSALFRLTLPTFTHYPFSSFCYSLCPSFAFSLFYWKDREIVHSDVYTHSISYVQRQVQHATPLQFCHILIGLQWKRNCTQAGTHTHTCLTSNTSHKLTVIFRPFILSW